MTSFRALVLVCVLAVGCSDDGGSDGAQDSAAGASDAVSTGDAAQDQDTDASAATDAGTVGDAGAGDVASDADSGSACTVAKCEASGPAGTCKTWSCSATGQCEAVVAPDDTYCKGDDPCIANATCKAGNCQGGMSICQCKPDDVSKCYGILGLNKDDLCAGQPMCAKVAAPKHYECQLNPASKVTCSDGDDTACAANTCDPKTGKCAMGPTNEGKPCDDGIACTLNSACKAGKCETQTNACECMPGDVSKCWPKLNLFESNQKCTGKPKCVEKADPASKQTDYECALDLPSVVTCDTSKDTKCLETTCDPKDGQCKAEPKNEGKPVCDDGDKCTVNDACKAGKCVGSINVCK